MKELETPEIFFYAVDLSNTLFNRWDNHAEQLPNGQYVCTHEPPNTKLMVKHLKGEITLGSYLLSEENYASFVVFDADDEASFTRICEMGLLSELPFYSERSRRGGHVWMFFERSVPGHIAKKFGMGILDEYVYPNSENVEVFPKQGSSQGPGSLIRVPFGIHRKSGERYPFIDRKGKPLGNWQQQMAILSSPDKIPLDKVEDYHCTREKPHFIVYDTDSDRIWERIKSSVDLMDFIGSFVKLRPTRTGGIGFCPFHDDEHTSFGVHKDGNYWHCFAGCGGGSVIDFWMKWHDCDFITALKELEEIMSSD